MAADASGSKKEALAEPVAGIEGDFVDVVLAVKGCLEAGDANPLRLLGVFPGLDHFADDARNYLPPPYPKLLPNLKVCRQSG